MMSNEPASSPHWHDRSSVTTVMLNVIYALVPGIACYVWFFGWGVLVQCILAVLFALLLEFLVLRIRQRDPLRCVQDGSAAVTAVLLALCISPLTPWWLLLMGVAFAIIIAKHVFGGIGNNIFNPAMAGYVFMLLSFPVLMNMWPEPAGITGGAAGPRDSLLLVFTHGAGLTDAITGATPLNDMKSGLGNMGMVSEIMGGEIYGSLAGKGWEWINFTWLLGGIYLLIRGFIKWHIPVAVISTVLVLSTVFHLYDSDVYAPALFHLFSGGTMLCAFFIATDPVTASTTDRGRLVYGCLIGMLLYVIRVWGGYPDGVAFAVLLANAMVPVIDSHTRPRVFGVRK